MHDQPFTTGYVIDATYRVESTLSITDRAHVYVVAHLRFPETPLVLKVASLERAQDFERDTSALAILTSRCIARVCDRGKLPDGRVYRVVERLAGPSLREALLSSATPDGRPFTEERALEMLVAMGSVVHEAHTNALGPIDLSIDNLMFADGRSGRLCMMRALVANSKETDNVADQHALQVLRTAVECGRDTDHGQTAGSKPAIPVTIEEIRAVMARTPPSSEPGEKIDQWRIVQKISESLHATIYDVMGNGGQTCILKVAGPRTDHDELNHHARLLAKVNSPHVVRVIDAGTHENAPYFVMERLYLSQTARLKERAPLAITNALETVDEMLLGAEAVAAAGGGPCDFSLDHCYQATKELPRAVLTHATAPNRVFRLYGSPTEREQADCWSAAVALYELIASRLPFPTSKHSLAKAWMGVPIPLGSRRRDVPPALSLLVTRVLTNDVRLTTRELRNELRRLRATPLPNKPPTPMVERRSIEPPAPAAPHAARRNVQIMGVGGSMAPQEPHPQPGHHHHPQSIPPPPPDWRVELSTLRCPLDPLTAAALSTNGRKIIAVGKDAIARYEQRQWTVDPARELASTPVRSLVPMGEDGTTWLALTVNGGLLRLESTGGFKPWGPSLDRYCFYAAIPDGESFMLVGGTTDDKRRGVVAKLVGESLTIVASGLDVKPLRAGTILSDGSMIACGEGGNIVRIRAGAIVEAARPCEIDLLATCVSRPPGMEQEVLVTGNGAWAFLVSLDPLRTKVEAVDTLSALSCMAVDHQGNAWVGTAKGRILRRRDRHWRRMNRSFEGDPAVIAIHASSTRMRAVLADGNIVVGVPVL